MWHVSKTCKNPMGKPAGGKSHNFSKMTTYCEAREKWCCFFEEMRIWFTECRKSWKQNWSDYSRTTWTTTKLQARHNSSTARVHARAFLRMEPRNNVNSHPGHVISLSVFKRIDISVAHGDRRYHCDLLSWLQKPKFLHGTEGAIETHHIHLGTCQAKQRHQASW